MKAFVCHKYGSPDVLQLKEVERPTPKDNEVLVRTYATIATAGDVKFRSATFPGLFWLPMRIVFGLRGPRRRILGQELSGEIEAVGKDVRLFKEGNLVFADTGLGTGGYAEYVCLPQQPEGKVRWQENRPI